METEPVPPRTQTCTLAENPAKSGVFFCFPYVFDIQLRQGGLLLCQELSESVSFCLGTVSFCLERAACSCDDYRAVRYQNSAQAIYIDHDGMNPSWKVSVDIHFISTRTPIWAAAIAHSPSSNNRKTMHFTPARLDATARLPSLVPLVLQSLSPSPTIPGEACTTSQNGHGAPGMATTGAPRRLPFGSTSRGLGLAGRC